VSGDTPQASGLPSSPSAPATRRPGPPVQSRADAVETTAAPIRSLPDPRTAASRRCDPALSARVPEVNTLLDPIQRNHGPRDPGPHHPPAPEQPEAGDLAATVSRPVPGVLALTVAGEVDTLTAPLLEAGVCELLDEAGAEPTVLVIDLTDVTFLASSGLAVLIRGANRLAERGAQLRLVAATRAVTRPLELTGADQLFEVRPSLRAALDTSD
jgi:anti-sigma B factor antagonist